MTVRIVEGEITQLGSVSGTDGTPIGINADYNRAQRFYIENPIAVIQTATGIASFVGAGEVVVSQDGSTIIVSGTPHVLDTLTLQDVYDNGTGVIQSTAGKPVVISGTVNEETFRVVGSGTFTEGLTVGLGSTQIDDHSIVTTSGIFSDSLTVSGIPVNLVAPDIFEAGVVTISGHLQNEIDAVEAGDVDSVNLVVGAVLVTGTQNVTTQTLGQIITITGPDLSSFATSVEVDSDIAAVSGTLSAEIDTDIATHVSNASAHHVRYTKEENDSIIGSDGITIVSGSNTIDVQGFRAEFVSTSGSLQSQIDAGAASDVDSVNAVTGAVLVTGTQNVTTQTTGQTITVTGPDLSSFATSVGVDSDIAAVSGTLSTEIDSDISTHSSDASAHHARYTKDENDAVTGSDGITIVSGSNTIDVAGFRTEFVSTSGSLQSQIDAVEAGDVDSVNDVIGAVLVTGTQNVTTQTLGQTITVTGPDLSSFATSAEVDSDVAAVSGTLSAEIDLDIATHTSEASAHHTRYSKEENDAILAGTNIVVVSGANDITISATAEPANALEGSDGITVTSGDPIDTIQGFRPEFLTASGSLQSQIDAVEASDVDSINSQTGSITIEGAGEVAVTTSSQTITVSGLPDQSDIDSINTVTGTLTVGGAGLVSITTDNSNPDSPTITISGSDAGAGGGSIMFRWEFKSLTAAADPGAGNFRLDNATPALANAIYVDSETKGGADAATVLAALSSGDRLYIQNIEDSTEFILVTITSVVDNTGWFTINITVDDGGPSFTDGKECGWVLAFAGIADHGTLTGLGDDDHPLYTLADGTRGFSATVSGADPVDSDDLTTKNYVDVELLAVSGTLSSEIDTDISTHAALAGAHHDKYTDAEAITALEPTTSQLAASGVATDANIVSVSGHLQTEIDGIIDNNDISNALVGSDGITVTSGDPTDSIIGFRGEFVSASGSLQTQIDGISPTTTLQDAYDNGDGIITTADSKPFQITGSGVVQGDLSVSGTYQGLPKTIMIENPNGAENLSFFFTPVAEEISRIIPTTSGAIANTGITWSVRFDSDRSNHSGATEVITGGFNTHLGNTGEAITSFDNASVPADSHIWVETTSVSGTMVELSLTVLF